MPLAYLVLLPAVTPVLTRPQGCEVVHLWGSVARGYHHKRKEADYMRTPDNIQRVRDRWGCLYYIMYYIFLHFCGSVILTTCAPRTTSSACGTGGAVC